MLKQNTLAEATTEQGFPKETGLPLRREVTLEDGTKVLVEGVTPEAMATKLNAHFVTPGEKYVDNGKDLNGVVQEYNEGAAPVTPVNYIVEAGKTYKFHFKQDVTLPEDIENKLMEELIQVENVSESAGNFIYGSMYMIGTTGVSDQSSYVKSYTNEALLNTFKSLETEKTIEDNTTTSEGWKNFAYTEDTVTITDLEVMEPIVINVKQVSTMEGTVSPADLSELNWVIENIEEVAE